MTKENVQCVADAQEAVDAAEQALLKARQGACERTVRAVVASGGVTMKKKIGNQGDAKPQPHDHMTLSSKPVKETEPPKEYRRTDHGESATQRN